MELYNILDELNIDYREKEHKPVLTMDDAIGLDIYDDFPGTNMKNLFLSNHKGKYFLVLIVGEKRADIKAIANGIGQPRLSFAKDEVLEEILGVVSGSVTPLGIINDTENKVTVCIDKDLIGKRLYMHPCTNTKTMTMESEDLIKFIKHLGHEYILIDA